MNGQWAVDGLYCVHPLAPAVPEWIFDSIIYEEEDITSRLDRWHMNEEDTFFLADRLIPDDNATLFSRGGWIPVPSERGSTSSVSSSLFPSSYEAGYPRAQENASADQLSRSSDSPQNSTDSNFNQARAFQENETNPADDAAPVANNDQDPPSDNSEANGNAQFAAHAIAIQPDQAPAALDYQGDDEISVGDRQAPALDIQHQQDNISLDNASHNSFRFSIFSDNSASN